MNNIYYKMNKATIIIFALFLGYVLAYAPCNATNPYALSGVCYLQCPSNPPTLYYSYDPTYTCQSLCPSPYYAFDGNRSCVTTCPNIPNVTYYDGVNSKCVSVCPTNYYAASNRSCVASCPSGTWGDANVWLCVTTCPTGTYYANVSVPICVTVCPANYYAYPINRLCYVGGSCPTSPVRYFSDDTTGLCVTTCPNGYFADNSTGRCLIYCSINFFADQSIKTCVTDCPVGYFRSLVTRSCVRSCTVGYYADSATNNCTTQCSTGTYGDNATGTCNKICTYPTFGDATVKLCVNICSVGLFADNFTQTCVTATNCYSNTIGDPTINKCINPQNCPTSPYMFADLTNKICTTRCATTWGDTTTRLCVSNCPWNPQTYVTWINTDTRQCVTQCPVFPIQYADNQTQTCVSTCPQAPIVPYSTFANPSTQSCVRQCPTGFFSDSVTFTCVKNCSTIPTVLFFNPLDGSCVANCPNGYFADPSKLACVTSCSSSPQYFSYNVNNTCLLVCPTNYFGDLSTGSCVTDCPQTTKQYAQSSTRLCVDRCPNFPATFGQIQPNLTRTCVSTCSVGLFADPISRTCVLMCNTTAGYYGQLLTPIRTCITQCPDGKYAQNTTGQCLTTCPSFPTLLFGNPVTKNCVTRCPSQLFGNPLTNLCVTPINCPANYFADLYSNLCVKLCPANQSTFGDPVSRTCVQVCRETYYADNTTRLCSTSCNVSAALYKDPSTKTCVKVCPSNPNLYADINTMMCSSTCSNNFFAYNLTRRCLSICPSTPTYYGDYQTYQCVTSCPNQTYIFTNNTFRGCLAVCPPRVYSPLYTVSLYADNTTWSCVTLCPESQNMFNFAHPTNSSIRICVTTCPMVDSTYYFAQNVTQSCVLTCPSATQLTYGDIFNSKCVLNCSRDQYRDNTTSRCVYQCSAGYFADNTTWRCVQECPTGWFAQSINRTCSRHCPTNFYADPVTKLCQALCNTQTYLFSDNTTWSCQANCTNIPDFYADNLTKLCSLSCTGGMFADPGTRSCVPALNCSNTSQIGDPISGRCVPICPIQIPSFLDSATNLCTQVCPAGMYADNSTMQCVSKCPSNPDYFAYNHSTLQGICVLLCPIVPVKYYRHNLTRECMTACPGPNYFRDTINLVCVTKCPPYYYAEVIGQICVLNCSANNKYAYNVSCYTTCPNNLNADPTTFQCVQVCPFGYFAQNGVCVINCTNGYADPFLKVCVAVCSPDYYAYTPTLQCRQDCQPQYKYYTNQTCIVSCPVSSNLSTNLYRDNTTYSCRNKCLPTWYADNSTGYCAQTCSSSLFADNSTGLCVNKCPSSPDYYGYNKVCYFPCPKQVFPNLPLFAENVTRTCMAQCPSGSFADSFNWRCVAICTGIQFNLYGPPPICVSICPSPLYGQAVSKTCIPTCPNGTFGQNTTRLCLNRCPTGSYADTHLNLCVAACNPLLPQFADPSTQRCVTVCPSIPSLYGEFIAAGPTCVAACTVAGWFTLNTTRLCVQNCPSPFFADPVTQDCASYCQVNYNYYADNVSRTCSSTCPNVTVNGVSTCTYADDSTKRCVWTCPFNPSLYGSNSTNKCVKKCPSYTYGDNDTRLCLQTCFFNVVFNGIVKYTYAENTTTFCLYQCPPGSWADNLTYTCVSTCSLGYYADSSTWKCVLMCPSNPISYAYSPNRTCIYGCPTGYFASQVGRICLLGTCPVKPFFYYRDYQNNQCVLKCVYPYFGQISSQSCVSKCSYGFYTDLGSMSCAACPSSCLTCVNSGNCTTCKAGLYLHQGSCVTNCPTFPVYYYKYDLSFTCIFPCPAPYFGFNGTGKCELTCPATYFKNITTSTCQTCPLGCNSCYDTNCTSCITGYVFVLKYGSCSKMCNLTRAYYLSRQCVNNCTSGTFLLDDLVTCQKCSSICAECSTVATNCTKCQGTYWYNYNCVSQCPDKYYVDKNNFCQLCSNNPTACTLPPLNFTFYTNSSRYQMYIYVVFNRAVKLTPQEFPTVCKIKTANGPLKSSQYKVTQTNPTTYQLLVINPSSLNQQSLSLSFDPGSIIDDTGVGLSTSTMTTIIGQTTSVTPQIQQQAQNLSKKVNVIGYILIVALVLMMVKCSYPQIVLLDLLQYIHLHVYILVNPMPYLFITVVSTLKNLNFGFLPALYTNPSPDENGNYYVFQTDTTFLGNCQPFVFFLAIFGGSYLLFWALSNRAINRWKWFYKKARSIFKNRMRFSFIHEIFYYTQSYVLFFAFYQFTGSNSYISASAANLAASVIVLLCYLVWLVWITYLGAKYRNRLDNIPHKYQFLVYQGSQFPMEIPFRGFFKLVVACVLIAGQSSVQIILLIVFNLVYIIYTLCYQPSKSKLTNVLNTLLMVCFIVCEIVLFVYSGSKMTSSYQNTISLVLMAVMGLMVLLVFTWIIYRFIVYIRQDVMGIKTKEEESKPKVSTTKQSKFDYEKIKYPSKKASEKRFDQKQRLTQKDKDMISELNLKDEDQQLSDAPQITADQAIQMFTYHHVPKKSEGQVQFEKQLMGIKETKKRNNAPIVIEVDQDELIYEEDVIQGGRQSARIKKNRIKTGGKRGHLRIEGEEGLHEVQHLHLQSKESPLIKHQDVPNETVQKQVKKDEQQSDESNYWTRKHKGALAKGPQEEHKVVWEGQQVQQIE